MNNLKDWAMSNNLLDVYNQYIEECEALEEELEAMGMPGNGSNYELGIATIQEAYPELFGNDEEE